MPIDPVGSRPYEAGSRIDLIRKFGELSGDLGEPSQGLWVRALNEATSFDDANRVIDALAGRAEDLAGFRTANKTQLELPGNARVLGEIDKLVAHSVALHSQLEELRDYHMASREYAADRFEDAGGAGRAEEPHPIEAFQQATTKLRGAVRLVLAIKHEDIGKLAHKPGALAEMRDDITVALSEHAKARPGMEVFYADAQLKESEALKQLAENRVDYLNSIIDNTIR